LPPFLHCSGTDIEITRALLRKYPFKGCNL